MNDEYYMNLAIILADFAGVHDEVPIGALVVKDDEIIAWGWNEKEKGQDVTRHAEVLALQRAARYVGYWRLTDCTLYTTLEPCPMCAGAAVLSRLKRVVYGAADPKMGCAGSIHNLLRESRFNHQIEVTTGVRELECGRLLSNFFVAKRQAKSANQHG
ncbi:MAG: tRNA adenosine(34) deaminase TadA [Methylocystaceae bacterium]